MFNIFNKKKAEPVKPECFDEHIGEEATYIYWGKRLRGVILSKGPLPGCFWMKHNESKHKHLASELTIKLLPNAKD